MLQVLKPLFHLNGFLFAIYFFIWMVGVISFVSETYNAPDSFGNHGSPIVESMLINRYMHVILYSFIYACNFVQRLYDCKPYNITLQIVKEFNRYNYSTY